jgi:hypothetical protein
MDQAQRLDCYAQFRILLALDRQLDGQLRSSLEKGISAMGVNPLENSTSDEIRTGLIRFAAMQDEAAGDGALAKYITDQRRAEVAAFGRSRGGETAEAFVHAATFGTYRPKASEDVDLLPTLDRERRFTRDLDFLTSAVASGTDPEIEAGETQMHTALVELNSLLPSVHSRTLQTRARTVVGQVNKLTRDASLQAECTSLLADLGPQSLPKPTNLPSERRPAGTPSEPSVEAGQ